jgi:DNA polymerase-1
LKSRRVICDVEGNGLKPTRLWVIVCLDIDTKEEFVFREPDKNPDEFCAFAQDVDVWIGHHFLGYDYPVLTNFFPRLGLDPRRIIDTLVVSKLVCFDRVGGHGLEAYGEYFGKPKPVIETWDAYSEDIVNRCIEDCRINLLVYNEYKDYIHSPRWAAALRLEHLMVLKCSEMTKNGFFFLLKEAKELREDIISSLSPLEEQLKEGFPKVLKLLKVVYPKETKFGTLNKAQFKFHSSPDLSMFNGGPFSLLEWQEFSPASPKQRIERLNASGWQPYNKTKGHKDALKDLRSYTRARKQPPQDLLDRLERFKVYGWTVDEENLGTLPPHAPAAAQKLVQWLMLSNRVSTLTTWINACTVNSGALRGIPEERLGDYGRIHGSFNPLGAWTHRMSHDKPNVGNIPSFNSSQPDKTPYSDKMRALWAVPPDRYLVGVDAESIQLRIFGHYINDREFINALISGRKEDGTDPHSLNRDALGRVCKSRDAAKTFIYAWLLGAGIEKVATILGCTRDEAAMAVESFIQRYPGLVFLREQIIPEDAARGWFEGFDGRCVRIRGDDDGSRRHFALAGYLQNGEVIIMKRALIRWTHEADRLKIPYWLANFVHDEYQTETIRDMDVARELAELQADSIRIVGEELNLRCPFAGSIMNGHGKLAIGDNWMETH